MSQSNHRDEFIAYLKTEPTPQPVAEFTAAAQPTDVIPSFGSMPRGRVIVLPEWVVFLAEKDPRVSAKSVGWGILGGVVAALLTEAIDGVSSGEELATGAGALVALAGAPATATEPALGHPATWMIPMRALLAVDRGSAPGQGEWIKLTTTEGAFLLCEDSNVLSAGVGAVTGSVWQAEAFAYLHEKSEVGTRSGPAVLPGPTTDEGSLHAAEKLLLDKRDAVGAARTGLVTTKVNNDEWFNGAMAGTVIGWGLFLLVIIVLGSNMFGKDAAKYTDGERATFQFVFMVLGLGGLCVSWMGWSHLLAEVERTQAEAESRARTAETEADSVLRQIVAEFPDVATTLPKDWLIEGRLLAAMQALAPRKAKCVDAQFVMPPLGSFWGDARLTVNLDGKLLTTGSVGTGLRTRQTITAGEHMLTFEISNWAVMPEHRLTIPSAGRFLVELNGTWVLNTLNFTVKLRECYG